jgi:hypothetical protein
MSKHMYEQSDTLRLNPPRTMTADGWCWRGHEVAYGTPSCPRCGATLTWGRGEDQAMSSRARYEMRPAGTAAGSTEVRDHTASNTEIEFDRMSDAARRASLAEPGRRFEVRYRGYSELGRDLLVAAWLDGEQLDIRTQQARDEDLSR